jgi:hypothetical protein
MLTNECAIHDKEKRGERKGTSSKTDDNVERMCKD